MARKKANGGKALCSAPDAEPGAQSGKDAIGARGSASGADHKTPGKARKPRRSDEKRGSTGSPLTETSSPSPPNKPKKPRKPRHDGWTELRRKTFLAVLRESGCVTDACRVAGMSDTSAYRLRRRDPEIAAAWEEALANGQRGLVAVAHQHAVVGKETIIYRNGVEVERRVAPSDSMMALLIKRGDLGGRVGSRTTDRVITWEEWQDGWRFDEEGKKVTREAEAAAVRASLDAKLAAMHERLLARRQREEAELREREARVAEREAGVVEGEGGECAPRLTRSSGDKS